VRYFSRHQRNSHQRQTVGILTLCLELACLCAGLGAVLGCNEHGEQHRKIF
jgi:hypothetical protein